MYLGAYRFAGDPTELLPAYRRMMEGFPPGALDLHVCAQTTDGIVVFDGCPSETQFRAFSASSDFADARNAVGLPEPTVEYIGAVKAAEMKHGFRA